MLPALHHPNPPAIYGVAEHALVTELVAGHTLAGPIPAAEAPPMIHRLMDVLEYSREKGIGACYDEFLFPP